MGLGTGIVVLVVYSATLICVASVGVPFSPVESLRDSILGFPDWLCPLQLQAPTHHPYHSTAVTEGDEVSLQKALYMVHKNSHGYVAVLFYASWCPFSRSFRPNFSVVSSLYPSIPHFAIEESAIRPSILSKYGVHGFPTLFLMNSTMRVRYHGSRTLGSLVAFYSDVTRIRTTMHDKTSLERMGDASNMEKHDNSELESCPFSWAKSPENLLRQETCLALATAFVVLRLLYIFFPSLLVFCQYAWRRIVEIVRLEHPLAFLNRVIQLFNSLKEPCKRSNLQGGAMNARAWASKSLATVSIGDASTSRVECH